MSLTVCSLWLTALFVSDVENVRKKGLLRYLNQMLDRLYVKDRLTGLFNRSGYERFAEEICRSFIGRDGGAQIIFIDMDGLKGINDRYGHDMGDEAIRESASILSSVCGHDDFVMRFGGDEFLVITSVLRSGFEEELRANLRKENERRKQTKCNGKAGGNTCAVWGNTSAEERKLSYCSVDFKRTQTVYTYRV